MRVILALMAAASSATVIALTSLPSTHAFQVIAPKTRPPTQYSATALLSSNRRPGGTGPSSNKTKLAFAPDVVGIPGGRTSPSDAVRPKTQLNTIFVQVDTKDFGKNSPDLLVKASSKIRDGLVTIGNGLGFGLRFGLGFGLSFGLGFGLSMTALSNYAIATRLPLRTTAYAMVTVAAINAIAVWVVGRLLSMSDHGD